MTDENQTEVVEQESGPAPGSTEEGTSTDPGAEPDTISDEPDPVSSPEAEP